MWIVALCMLPLLVLPNIDVADSAFRSVGGLLIGGFLPSANHTPKSAPKEEWKQGETLPIALTLITADYNKLSCAHDKKIEGFHCQYESATKVWPREPGAPLEDNKKSIIQPYRTTGNDLIFVAGLWAEPHVALRLHQEPPYSRRETKLARFTANCKLQFVGQLPKAQMRWAQGGAWMSDGDPWVAKVVGCEVD